MYFVSAIDTDAYLHRHMYAQVYVYVHVHIHIVHILASSYVAKLPGLQPTTWLNVLSPNYIVNSFN